MVADNRSLTSFCLSKNVVRLRSSGATKGPPNRQGGNMRQWWGSGPCKRRTLLSMHLVSSRFKVLGLSAGTANHTSQTEIYAAAEFGDAPEAFLWTPAPVLDNNSGLASAVTIYRMGNRSDAKIQGKWERKWKMAPGLKWPKNGCRNEKIEKNGQIPFLGPFFHFGGHFSAI